MVIPDKPDYDEMLSIREALQIYFQFYGFKNGGYDDKWFKIKFAGPLVISLPNIEARVRAVKLHDIHHVVTGYPATLKGEALIGAWELASGCGKFYVGWLLNFAAFLYGVLFWPREIYQAFNRGLESENLYHGTEYDEKLLSTTVGTIRSQLLSRQKGLPKSRLSFLLWLSAAIVSTLLALIILILFTNLLLKLFYSL